jgi:hypothetical protein
MAWVAEILRKNHRTCHRCRLGPTHVYDPPLPEPGAHADPEDEVTGFPLCNGCLAADLERDLSLYQARCVLFEPALGPDSLAFRPVPEGRERAGEDAKPLEAALSAMEAGCSSCDNAAHFIWVPVEADANLWPGDWLAGLADGSLAPAGSLCGGCAARRLMRSIEKRGLYFDAIVPPRDVDGIFCGWEV